MLLVGKKFIEEKHRLYKEQNGVCCICGNELNPDVTSNHLDHDHSLEGPNAGKVRGLLCCLCNGLDGQLLHKFNSSGLVAKGADLNTWVTNWLSYQFRDLSNANIHPVYVNDKAKAFKYLNKPEMIAELESINAVIPAKATKAQLCSLYKKALRNYLKGTVK
jgi:hypothetical protein